MQGWVKIHRCIWKNPIVTKDPEHFVIWMWLLTNAQYEDKDVVLGGKRITLKRGQLLTSKRVISEQLNINESKVYRTLNELQSETQIETQKTRYGTVISILNWNKYQLSETPSEPPNEPQSEPRVNHQTNHERTTSEPQNEPPNISSGNVFSDFATTSENINHQKANLQVNQYKEYIKNKELKNLQDIQQHQDSTSIGGGGRKLLSDFLHKDDVKELLKNYVDAFGLIETVNKLVTEPEKIRKPYRYIVGYANKKNWPKIEEGLKLV